MTIGDYYVLRRQLRTDGTMEFVPQVGRAMPNRGQAILEARYNAQRLKGDRRPFGVEVHEVIGVGEVGGRPQFVTVFVIENGCEKAGGPPSVGLGTDLEKPVFGAGRSPPEDRRDAPCHSPGACT